MEGIICDDHPRQDGPDQSAEMPVSGEKPKVKLRRGFAAMSREKQREIASLGGKIAHKNGTAHVFSSDEARAAGQKGGATTQRRRRARRFDGG